MNLIHAIRFAKARMLHRPPSLAAVSAAEKARLGDNDRAEGCTIVRFIRSQGFDADGLEVKYHRPTESLYVYGIVTSMSMRDRILSCCCKVSQVCNVIDRIVVLDLCSARTIPIPPITRQTTAPSALLPAAT